jgi:hypothetical protein
MNGFEDLQLKMLILRQLFKVGDVTALIVI